MGDPRRKSKAQGGMGETRPTGVASHHNSQKDLPAKQSGISRVKPRKNVLRIFAVGFAVSILFLIAATSGAWAGYKAAANERSAWHDAQEQGRIVEQYELSLLDIQEGRYEVARQRLEWVLAQDPTYPGATDRMLEVVSVLYVTATPTALPPTGTPTPTPDMRPVQDLFATAEGFFRAGDWSTAIDALLNLRGADQDYNVAQVDRMLYLSLRQRGVDKILAQGDLVGGTYDLALAEGFGPLDVHAANALDLARMYLYGSAYFGAYPEKAVYYFSQVVAASPYLRDAAGWTARERYREALIQYGDQLAAAEEWCLAQEQYQIALSIRADQILQDTVQNAAEQCSPPTETPSPTWTPTLTATLTSTATSTAPVIEITPSPTPTITQTPTPTLPGESETATPTPSPSPPPESNTPTPTEDAETPTPSPTTEGIPPTPTETEAGNPDPTETQGGGASPTDTGTPSSSSDSPTKTPEGVSPTEDTG